MFALSHRTAKLFDGSMPAWCLRVFAASLFIFSGANAQPVQLEDVIRGVVTNSPLIDLENERVRGAEGELLVAQGPLDWTATAEGGWQKLYVVESRDGFLTDNLQDIDAWRTSLGISCQFRNGITVQPGVTFFVDNDVNAAQSLGQTKTRPSLNLTIPLLRGYGADSPVATAERAARLGFEASQHGREFGTQRTVSNAVLVFWRCLALHRQFEYAQSDHQEAEEFVQAVRDLVGQGLGDPVVMDRAAAGLAMQNVALARARAGDESCKRELDVAMGGDGLGDLPIPVGEFPEIDSGAAARLNENALAESALLRREDVRAVSLQSAAFSERVRGAQDGMQPLLNVLVDTRGVLLRVSQSLGRNAQQGQLISSLAGEGEARINLRQLESQVRLDVTDKVRNIFDAVANWQALNTSTAAMKIVAGEAETRYNAGLMTRREYRDVQAEYATVQTQLIETQFQYASNIGALRLALGRVEAGENVPVEMIAGQFRSLPDN
nr:MAG: TolC family protein [Hyphomicrobiales bacterium]